MENLYLEGEDMEFSRKLQGKRLLADYETCKIELRIQLELLFETFDAAIAKANRILFELPRAIRARGTEASIVQSCFAEELFFNFGTKAFFGKHRRLILLEKGYVILFKKLNNRGMPMNIQTDNIQSILNQNMSSDLFANTEYGEDPILYFGYQKNRIGEYINPQLIYIDEGLIQFTISRDDISPMDIDTQIVLIDPDIRTPKSGEVVPSLKEKNKLRKTN